MPSETKKSPFVITYQALSKLSLGCYQRFGEDAIPAIRDAWYEMGLELGERLKSKREIGDFKSAAEAINDLSFKLDELGGTLLELSDKAYHFRTKSAQPCAVGLGDAGRPICEAVMSVNQGQFKSTCGVDVDMNIIQSRATGADCCEVVFSPKGK
ncbi:MAG: hypothetical protein R6U37_01995 [Dehalococcoidia bacterium]